MNVFSDDAGMQMKIAIDTNILANVYSDADSNNSGATAGAKSGDINLGVTGTPLVVTKADILDVIVDCGTVLTEQDVPETQRSLVIPVWFAGMILKSDQLVPCVGNSTVHNQVNCWNSEMRISTQASNEEGSTTTGQIKYAKAA